ncbi:MAG: YlxR family protein [Lachnospiraceae bacterium]|nr:YlxR family protein [Lachnospiraceae bacterium]
MGKKPANRTCVGCRNSFDKKELIRVIRNQDGLILIDKTGRANGRGAYICNDLNCFKLAKKNHGLERSLKIEIPDAVYEQLEQEVSENAE